MQLRFPIPSTSPPNVPNTCPRPFLSHYGFVLAQSVWTLLLSRLMLQREGGGQKVRNNEARNQSNGTSDNRVIQSNRTCRDSLIITINIAVAFPECIYCSAACSNALALKGNDRMIDSE